MVVVRGAYSTSVALHLINLSPFAQPNRSLGQHLIINVRNLQPAVQTFCQAKVESFLAMIWCALWLRRLIYSDSSAKGMFSNLLDFLVNSTATGCPMGLGQCLTKEKCQADFLESAWHRFSSALGQGRMAFALLVAGRSSGRMDLVVAIMHRSAILNVGS